MSRITVVAGRNRTEIGTIEARPGMPTSQGRVIRVTDAGTVYTQKGDTIRRTLAKHSERLTMPHSEAVKRGYPNRHNSLVFRVPGQTTKV